LKRAICKTLNLGPVENGPALAIVANVVPELPLADLGISVAARKALRSVTAWWLIEAQAASEGRQI